MLQMIGRGLRTVDPSLYPGVIKKDCIVLDFWPLPAHARRSREQGQAGRQAKTCPACLGEVPYSMRECPLCGHEFKAARRGSGGDPDAEDGPEAVSDVVMGGSGYSGKFPFRWCDIFGSGKVMIASGFEAWSAVCSADGETWQALGKLKEEKALRRIAIGERVPTLAAADDFCG